MPPTIETPHLFLAPYRASMVSYRHIGWLNHKEGMKFSEQRHHVHTLESQHQYLNSFPIGSHIWLIIARGHSVHIGTITAHIDPFNRTANMGIMIGEFTYRGAGYGSEAWSKVMEFLWADGIEKIEAGMMLINEPMIKLCKKTGMVLEGVRPKHFLVDNKRIDLVQYGSWRTT